MGKLYRHYLGGGTIYRCSTCRCHLALHDALMSKRFQGRYGKAFLFADAINIHLGPSENRMLSTGLHTVCDMFCCGCRDSLGWYYAEAFEDTQKYKEGKFLLEKEKIVKETITE